jgi:hypothetical protein
MPGDSGCCFHPEHELEVAPGESPSEARLRARPEPVRPLHESLTDIDERGLRHLEAAGRAADS